MESAKMSFEIKEGTLLKYIGEDSRIEIAIPEGVTHIGCAAFI